MWNSMAYLDRFHIYHHDYTGKLFVTKLFGIVWTPIRYKKNSVTLPFRDQRRAASLRYRNRAEITVPYVWTEALSGMVFVPAQKLSGIRVWTPIRYVTLVFRDRRGAEQLRSVTEIAPKSPFLMCEQKPYLVWFSCQHKSYPVSGYEHLSDMWLSSLEIGAARSSFAPLQKSLQNHRSLCVNRSPIWYGFRASTKAIRYQGMNTYPICDSRL